MPSQALEVFSQYNFTDLPLCPSRYSHILENRTLWWGPKPMARGWSFSLCELSARCRAEALLFVPPFRDQASSEENVLYFASACARLQ
jgi:hypothetical protein